jgi:ribosomal protein L34E
MAIDLNSLKMNSLNLYTSTSIKKSIDIQNPIIEIWDLPFLRPDMSSPMFPYEPQRNTLFHSGKSHHLVRIHDTIPGFHLTYFSRSQRSDFEKSQSGSIFCHYLKQDIQNLHCVQWCDFLFKILDSVQSNVSSNKHNSLSTRSSATKPLNLQLIQQNLSSMPF